MLSRLQNIWMPGRTAILTRLMPALAVCVCLFAAASRAQTPKANVSSDPGKARFVTSDIDNFWRAFDLAQKERDPQRRIAIYQTEYIDKASPGLKDFVRVRIKSAKDLAATVDKLPRFYASVRPATLRIAKMEREMRNSFRKFKRIYPDAVFPDVYFVIGIANTGGTATDSGLLIGAELYGLADNTPRDEFPAFFKTFLPKGTDDAEVKRLAGIGLETALKRLKNLPSIVAHESCHFNQNLAPQTTLLGKSLQEGACDLIAELTAGAPLNPKQIVFGDAHQADLWREFKEAMNGTDLSRWLYNSFSSKDRPGDLGYYMGYKITWAYYRRAKDKRQAIKDILNIKDFPAFLERSGYPEGLPRK